MTADPFPTEDAAIFHLVKALNLVHEALAHADFEAEERLEVEREGVLYALARCSARTAEGRAAMAYALRIDMGDANIRDCSLAAHGPTMALVTSIIADIVPAA